MTKRIQKLLLGVAAIAAMALGGAIFANAQSSSPPAASESTAGPDTDNVQSGDQTTPDAPKATAVRASSRHAKASSRHAKAGKKHASKAAAAQSSSSTQEQPGSESTTEQPGSEAPETGTETESAPGSDGPGGHADEPGNPNADHQNQGVE